MDRTGNDAEAETEIEDVGRRARDLAAAAVHDSVTVTGLLSTVADGGHLHDAPPLAHLEPGERPEFLFRNGVKGVGTGWRVGSTRPDPDAGTVVLVTDRRVVGVVGRERGDVVFAVPHADATAATSRTQLLKARLTVETADERYHFWVDRRVSRDALDAAAEYVERGGRAGGAEGSDDG